MAFIACASLLICMGIVDFVWLVPHPSNAGLAYNDDSDGDDDSDDGDNDDYNDVDVNADDNVIAASDEAATAGVSNKVRRKYDFGKLTDRNDGDNIGISYVSVSEGGGGDGSNGGSDGGSGGDVHDVGDGGVDGDGDDIGGDGQAVTFRQALAIPGVISMAAALFFSKLVAYSFLYWLPVRSAK
jgi:hypothetical protein